MALLHHLERVPLGRTAVAVLVAASLLRLLTVLVDDAPRTVVFNELYVILGIVFVIDLLWAVGCSVWPKKRPASVKEQVGVR